MKKTSLIISLLFLSITHTYAQKRLTEENLVEHYGAIRKEMVLKACEYCNFTDKEALKKLNVTSVTAFRNSLDQKSGLYGTIVNSAKPLFGTEIESYSQTLILSDSLFINNLVFLYRNKRNSITEDYKSFLIDIENLTQECIAFNNDNASYLEQYPNGRFVILLNPEASAENNLLQDPSNDSRKTPEEENKELKKQNKVLEEEIAELKAENKNLKSEIAKLKGINPDDEGFSNSWIIILIILMLLGAYVYHLHKKGNNILSQFILLLPRRSNVNKHNNRATNGGTIPEPSPVPTPKPNPVPNPVPQPVTESRPQLQSEKFAIENNEWIIVGASVIGRGHIESNMPCQDSNSYASLGNGWGIAITSDGAGSAKHSHVGSKIVVTRAKAYFEQLILASSWYKNNILPDDITWSKAAFKALKAVRDDMQNLLKKSKLSWNLLQLQ